MKGLIYGLTLLLTLLTGCEKEPEVVADKSMPLQTTVWKLAQLDLGQTPGELAEIPQHSHVGFVIFRAEDQTLIGWAGCQQVDGRYRVDGQQLQVQDLTLTGSRCYRPRFDHVGDQFAQALRGVTSYRLASDDARLELLTDGRITAVLLYRKPEKDKW